MDVSYIGRIRGGVVVFEGQSPPLPDGTEVRVEPVPLASRRGLPVVKPLARTGEPRSYREVMAAIHERQRRRDHRPPTRQDVDDSIRAEREGWGE